MKHSNTSEPPKQFYQRNDSIYPMGSISRMNERGRMWEASQDLITQIEECYGKIATNLYWDDDAEPYTYLCGRVKVANGQLREGSDVFVMFFRVYSCGDTQELEYFRKELQFELDNIKKFLEENSVN